MSRPYNFNQIPYGRFGKGLTNAGLNNGMGNTELPITTLDSYSDSSGLIDSSGSSILGLLTPPPVINVSPTPSILPILLILGIGGYIWYQVEGKKIFTEHKEKVPKVPSTQIVREVREII